MFELYFLLYHIPKRIRALAKSRNQNAWAWSLMAIGSWIGAEVLIFFLSGVLIVFKPELERSVGFLFGTYVLALGLAALAASVIISKLRKMPLADETDAPWQ